MQQQQLPLPDEQNRPYRRYNSIMLLVMVGLCILSLCMLIVPFSLISNLNDTPSGHNFLVHNANLLGTISAWGVLLLLAESIGVMIVDWRGSISLRGMIRQPNTGYVLLYFFFPEIMLPIYALRVVFDYFRHQNAQRQQEKQQQKFKVAELEAKAGILPPTDGQCRICHKPLIVGAEFCQYCGAPAVERPKVCPACSTTALPDAKFCPKCRTPLL